ncbi:MAG: TolC family protein, partial [Gammaproteobacteria bacterium]
MWTPPAGSKRQRRVDAAQKAQGLLAVEVQARQLDVLAEVTRRFIHVAADQQQIALTRRARELAAKTVAEVEKRVKAAKSPEVELHRARIALTRAQVEEEHA